MWASEADGTLTFSVAGDGTNSESITVNFATADGSADSSDYGSASGSLTIDPFDTSSHDVSVSISNDTDAESDESFTLNLTDESSVFLGSATGTIQDDDSTGGSGSGSGSGSGGGGGTPEASISDS